MKNQDSYIREIEQVVSKREGSDFAKILMTPIWNKYKKACSMVEGELEKGADVVIDPLEWVDFSHVAVSGDWGDEHLEIESRYDDILKLAKEKGRKVRVVVFDTGRPDHFRLEDLIDDTYGKNWTQDQHPDDKHSHATHCSGIVAGVDTDQNRSPIADAGKLELAWHKVLSDSGSGSFTWIADAISYENEVSKSKIAEGYFVIYSMSLGGGNSIIDNVEATLKEANEIGVLTLAAAGNTGGQMNYPGVSNYAKGIGALQKGTPPTRASFSAYGPRLWGSTPGALILSTIPGDKYATKSGTSMATPYMAYIASIVACINPSAKWHDVIGHIVKYATDLGESGRDDFYGFGWPPVSKLIDNPLTGTPPPPPPQPAPLPDKPVIEMPRDGEIVETNPKVQWSKDDKALTYLVSFYYGTRKITYGTTTNYVVYRQEEKGDYAVEVTGVNIEGNYGPTSDRIKFSIVDRGDNPPPPPPPDDPPPPPPPTKPSRVYTNKFPTSGGMYSTEYFVDGEKGNKRLRLKIEVSIEGREDMASFHDKIESMTKEHFRRRAYGLKEGSDFWDAGKAAAEFYAKELGKVFDKVSVLSIEAEDEQGRSVVILADQINESSVGLITFKV